MENSTHCFANGSNSTSKAVIIQAVFGGVATLICGVITVLILCLKAYRKFTDRIIICITLSAFLLSVSMVLSVVSQSRNEIEETVFDGVCRMVGYLQTFTMWMMALFLAVIALYIIVFLVAGKDKVSKFEKPILLIIPIVSAVMATIPFATNSYGSSVAWCWIDSRENGYKRSTAVFVEQVVLGYAPQIIATLFNSLTAMYVAYVVCRQRRADGQYMEAVKETIVLVMYPPINLLLYLVGLANRIDHYIKDPHCDGFLWWLAAVLYPPIGVVTTVALLIQVSYNEHMRKKNRMIRMKEPEERSHYIVPPEFEGETEPLIIRSTETGAQEQEPKSSVYSTVFLNDSINTSLKVTDT